MEPTVDELTTSDGKQFHSGTTTHKNEDKWREELEEGNSRRWGARRSRVERDEAGWGKKQASWGGPFRNERYTAFWPIIVYYWRFLPKMAKKDFLLLTFYFSLFTFVRITNWPCPLRKISLVQGAMLQETGLEVHCCWPQYKRLLFSSRNLHGYR